ncbi:MAG: c-type cytochrome [Thermoanaerobaculia bacterium]
MNARGSISGREAATFAALFIAALASAGPRPPQGTAERPVRPAESSAPGTSPVSGESWVKHLHLSLDETTLGGIGRWGPSPGSSGSSARPTPSEVLDAPFLVTGKDLYRLSCQSCHREDGSGAPPEILPVTSLARATSAAFFRQKMKERGLPVDEAMLAKNAAEAEASLRNRIRNGGVKMPPFPQLGRAETESLIAYVKELAGIPEKGPERPPLREPSFRVGELLVKGTCHICHDSWAAPTTAFEYRVGYGEPPPLTFFTEQRTNPQVIRKVREGLVEPSVSATRGRMPVFGYLSPEEVTAAYLYLLVEPPRRGPAEASKAPERESRSAGGGRPKL